MVAAFGSKTIDHDAPKQYVVVQEEVFISDESDYEGAPA